MSQTNSPPKPLNDRGPQGPIRSGEGTNHGSSGTQGNSSPPVPRQPGNPGPYSR